MFCCFVRLMNKISDRIYIGRLAKNRVGVKSARMKMRRVDTGWSCTAGCQAKVVSILKSTDARPTRILLTVHSTCTYYINQLCRKKDVQSFRWRTLPIRRIWSTLLAMTVMMSILFLWIPLKHSNVSFCKHFYLEIVLSVIDWYDDHKYM